MKTVVSVYSTSLSQQKEELPFLLAIIRQLLTDTFKDISCACDVARPD